MSLTLAAYDANGQVIDVVEIDTVTAANVRSWVRHFRKLHSDLATIMAGSSLNRVFTLNARAVYSTRDGDMVRGKSLSDFTHDAYDALNADYRFECLKGTREESSLAALVGCYTFRLSKTHNA